ncbi:endo-1,4-beta-xylanase [Tolypothrix tenuis PCC 7101]|uniref:Beta-xylanase n=1 Tax=Tolypothrix tenuis PCC 7101 TaxID=231146 RepID=A0A1Z4MSQ7_9CYAN|nr:endo-1,4-beta-xylanase [Aulosira sp. FACHB-113]BAY96484.1 endo-1,4-beta-xylanase [Tolypothrix tenuis PCC 7101]BAZ73010.1 endo-1,4-beta-xylanase [Aulosira laxa NIES-50]
MVKNRMLNRRGFLYLGLGTAASIGALTISKAMPPKKTIPVSPLRRDFQVVGQTPLKIRAASKGLIYGADCGTLNLEAEPELAKVLVRECSMLVAGFLKWDLLRPTPDSFDFQRGDWFAKFARNNKMSLRGHTLVWYMSLPAWFKETVNKQNAKQFLTQHIQKVMGHYAGQMHSWDVVNEAIAVEDGYSRGLRKMPWLEFLGPDYIEMAFRIAAQADPKAQLVYNDYGLEYDTPENEAKRNAVLKLLEHLKSREVPIHAFGIQSHLLAHETRFNPQKLQKFLKEVADLGLKIMVTELDVIDQELPADVAVRDRIVAAAYEDYLGAVLEVPAVNAVINWGLSDRHTWLAEFQARKDGAAVRPLAWDADFKPKLAWNAIARAFDKAPKR